MKTAQQTQRKWMDKLRARILGRIKLSTEKEVRVKIADNKAFKHSRNDTQHRGKFKTS